MGKISVDSMQDSILDVRQRTRDAIDVDHQLVSSSDEVRKESMARRAEAAQLADRIRENMELLEKSEQQWIKAETALQQDSVDAKASLKKEARERELMEARLQAMMREESLRREEAIERESRARKEAEARNVESFQATLREERRARENELLRIEDKSLGCGKPGVAAITDHGHMDSSL